MSEDAATGPEAGLLVGGRYRLHSVLGQGGMGVVYRAAQESLARPVAVKVLQPTLATDSDAVLRFRAEAERAGRLAHPHIVQILDFGREPSGAVWIAMELLEGESLAARIERAPMSEAEVVRVAIETLSALEAAHGASLVHRDLKPDNIFLSQVPGIGVSVKVLDFGIAKLLEADGASKLTATGVLIGTPLYMAPEQAQGHEVDTRADLYSLGALLYEALTQAPPLTGKTYPALLLAVMTQEPRPLRDLRPEISPGLADVIARAMAKEPSQRFQSAAEMAAALRQLTPSESVPTQRGARDLALATAPTMATPLSVTPASVATAPATEQVATVATAAPAPVRGWSMGVLAIGGATVLGGLVALLGAHLLTRSSLPPTPPVPEVPVSATPVVGMEPMRPEAPPSEATERAATESPPTESPPTERPAETAATERPTHATDPAPATRPSHRTAGPRSRTYTARVSLVGMTFAGMAHSSDLRGPIEADGAWGSCWPSDVEPPTVNQGRSFLIDIAGDGAVVGVRPATPTSAEPASFASCVMRRIRRIHFPPPVSGSQIQVRVGFGIN